MIWPVVLGLLAVVWLIWAIRWLRWHKRASGVRTRYVILQVILDCERAAARREGRPAKFPMTYEEMYAWRDGLSSRLLVPKSFNPALVKL